MAESSAAGAARAATDAYAAPLGNLGQAMPTSLPAQAPNSSISEELKREFGSIVATIIAQTFATDPLRAAAARAQATTPVKHERYLKSEDLGFFDPEAEKEGNLVTQGKHIFYRDVYAFANRLRDMASLKGEPKVQEVWTTCLKGTAHE